MLVHRKRRLCVFVTGATVVLVAEVEDERQNKEPTSFYEQKCTVIENTTKNAQNSPVTKNLCLKHAVIFVYVVL